MNNECQFCIDNQSLKGEILAQNNLCYFVESIDPVLKHAGLIIPFRHAETPFDLNKEEWNATQDLLHKAKTILDEHNPDGYNIGWNIGADAGQHMFHAHLHVIARFADEPLRGKGIRYAFKQESNQRPDKK